MSYLKYRAECASAGSAYGTQSQLFCWCIIWLRYVVALDCVTVFLSRSQVELLESGDDAVVVHFRPPLRVLLTG